MRLLFIQENDHELFMSSLDGTLYNFFLDHLDTFRQMWEEQGKAFWVRFLMAFRDYVYNKGQGATFIQEAGLNYSIHDLAIVGDAIFINIHRHFIEGKAINSREFMEDAVCLAQNRHLLVHIGKKSIVNNPLYIKEVRDSFRKLFLYPQFFQLNSQDLTVFHIGLATPIYLRFCGAVSVLLKRWIACRNCMEGSVPVYWPIPHEWKSPDFHLSPFQLYLQHVWTTKLDGICGIEGLHKALAEKMNSVKSKSKTGNSRNSKDTFMNCESQYCSTEEMKERKIFLMAEKQFEEESSQHCNHSNKTKKKKKKKNAIRNAIELASKNVDAAKPSEVPNPQKSASDAKESKDCGAAPVKENKKKEETHPKLNGIDAELKQISQNIDSIQFAVKEEGGLDFESFLLMLRTGELLMKNTQTFEDDKEMEYVKIGRFHDCSHCGKKETSPKTFKKCSRCKVEKIAAPRYYCSRECQVEDWEECHRVEHSLLQRK